MSRFFRNFARLYAYMQACAYRAYARKALKQRTKENMASDIQKIQQTPLSQGEIILYQPDETISLEVRVDDETVWLNRKQMADLFGRDVKTIGKHVNNALREELRSFAVVAKFATTAKDGKTYQVEYYNLDMVLSVGYRVKSAKGIEFRVWANQVLKDYLIRGYAINQQLLQMEQRMDARLDAHIQKEQEHYLQIESTLSEHQQKIDFFVRTNQPPVEGVFFEGQIFDAYRFVEALVMSAQREIELREHSRRFHDRFLILDDQLYHFGASFKDLGRKLFAFERMGIDKHIILSQL